MKDTEEGKARAREQKTREQAAALMAAWAMEEAASEDK